MHIVPGCKKNLKKTISGCKPEICVRCREEGKIDCYQKAWGIGERTEGR